MSSNADGFERFACAGRDIEDASRVCSSWHRSEQHHLALVVGVLEKSVFLVATSRLPILTSPLRFDNSIIIESLECGVQPDEIIRSLGALAQEHRLAAFRLLVQAGASGIPAGILAEKLGVPPSSMSFHLAQLFHAGLVTQRRESRSVIYSADYAAMNELMSYLTENCCGGIPCEDAGACQPASHRKTA